MRKTNCFLTFLSLLLFLSVNASETKQSDTTKLYEISLDDQVLIMIDSVMSNKFYQTYGLKEIDSVALVDRLIPFDSIIPLEDSILEYKLSLLNKNTPIDLQYNRYVKAFINLYINRKRDLSNYVLGVAPRYYPMFEEVLDRFQMPLELKHLAVVESALKPSARSWVGAQGLWQFMYPTGKMYGLNVTSYYDDRMDPYKSTVAACQYMMDLYKMYKDWNMVLAAYNSGPGNVNKAIRRSGGHRDYWKIRPYLPRETQGYVPAFIAVNYMMNYAADYSIFPKVTAYTNLIVDTVQLNRAMTFSQISNYIEIPKDLLAELNPMYKLEFIPESKSGNTLVLPIEKIGVFLVNENNIYADMRRIEIEDSIAGKKVLEQQAEMFVHHVRNGEFLGYIANKYRVSVRDLMAWNNLQSSRLNVGDRLRIYPKAPAINTMTSNTPSATKHSSTADNSKTTTAKYKFHLVKSGDTLWDIANMYSNTTVNELKRLNGDLNIKRLQPGMKLKVKEI